jgi:hypothetical protein
LQQIDVLPPIYALQQDVRDEIIDDCQVQYDSTRKFSHYNLFKMAYYKDHAEDFFKFYRHFNFDSNIISIVHGTLIERQCYYFDIEATVMNIVLLKPDQNLTKHVTPQQVRDFREICRNCFNYMRENYNPEIKFY